MNIACYNPRNPISPANIWHSNYEAYYHPQSRTKKYSKCVVFVLGAPGSGKGTLCAAVAQHFGYIHYSIGDLLRAECRSYNSKLKDEIEMHMRNGTIVPSTITVRLLEKAIFSSAKFKNFIIDAFPYNQQNLEAWTKRGLHQKVDVALVFLLDVPLTVCAKRCIGRNQGRADDNEECIEKRLLCYINQSQPIIEHYKKLNMIHVIDASKTTDEVFNEAKNIFNEYRLTKNNKN